MNPSAKAEATPLPKPRMLSEAVRDKLRAGHYSRRTEEAYLGWIRRFIKFHGARHPREMGEAEIAGFLGSLAVAGKVAAATQNQALNALMFLYSKCKVKHGALAVPVNHLAVPAGKAGVPAGKLAVPFGKLVD